MNDVEPKKMITVQLEEKTAGRFAVFCKRALIERVRPFAANESKACRMMTALTPWAMPWKSGVFAALAAAGTEVRDERPGKTREIQG
jgi:hypothetical protein